MMGKAPTDNSKGVRVINLPQVRDIINEELELMLNGQQDAKTALDKAVERANAAIKEAADL
jgi:sn-glycerol 3-phosphate transport system substrate-binding protein